MLAACRRGLEVLDDHRVTLGASELRAQATARGGELAALAQRHAVRARRPRLLLVWTERWRATALTVPSVRPSADTELNAGLAALREVTSRLEEARRQGTPTGPLQREQLRLEGVGARPLAAAPGVAGTGRSVIDVGALLDQLGGTRSLSRSSTSTARCTCSSAGPGGCGSSRPAAPRTRSGPPDFAPFALRRLARGRAGANADSARAMLNAGRTGAAGRDARPGGRQLGDAPVVIVPPGKLHAVPWALLPALGSRVFSVAPSAQAWLRARAAKPPGSRRVTLARGPGLTTDGAEVPVLAACTPTPPCCPGRSHGRAGAVRDRRRLARAHRRARDVSAPTARCSPRCRMRGRAADRLRLRAAAPRALPAGAVQLRLRRRWPRPVPTSCSAWSAACCRWARPASLPASSRSTTMPSCR